MSKKVYVGNLNYATTENTLRTLFAEFGEIESVNLIIDRQTGRSKGFAFVELSTEQAAQEAIGALNGKQVDERPLKVDQARPRPDRNRQQSDWGRSRW
jgi:cold-inducible RNA-binding protein